MFWISKRQGAVATSTYVAEFMALRHGTEEIMHIRYMLCCLGVPVTKPSNIFGDNLGIIQNATNVDAELTISLHAVREAIAAGILIPYLIKGKNNISDIMTKQIAACDFLSHVETLFWQPTF